jgi:photosystem II stability/assembly factor-like uncharacterized protein
MRKLFSVFYAAVITCCIVSSVDAIAQPGPYKWQKLAVPEEHLRYNDLDFITSQEGWLIGPYEGTDDTAQSYGQVFHTTNGGITWTLVSDSSIAHFRSVQFVNSQRGFMGSYGRSMTWGHSTDTIPLFQTNDGGHTWQPVTNITGEMPSGICGMYALDGSHIYAIGRFSTPGHFIKSTDAGESWHSQRLTKMNMAIDCYFFSRDTGIIVGGTDYDPEDPSKGAHDSSQALIQMTTDGGATWNTVYHGHRDYEWCWKISFPTRMVGYVSIQSFNKDSLCVLKTTDGGLTWKRMVVLPNANQQIQAIGFLNESIGYIAGYGPDGFYTTDGGKSWKFWDINNGGNRFRFFGDSVAYLAGKGVLKMQLVSGVERHQSLSFSAEIVRSRSNAQLKLTLEHPREVHYEVIDILGRVDYTSTTTLLSQGANMIELPAIEFAPAFVRIHVGGEVTVLKL